MVMARDLGLNLKKNATQLHNSYQIWNLAKMSLKSDPIEKNIWVDDFMNLFSVHSLFEIRKYHIDLMPHGKITTQFQ